VFVGIRYGNLWNRDLGVDLRKPGFLADLNMLAQFGLELDTANPDPNLIHAVVDVADRIPELRIVIDHLPHAAVPTEATARKEYQTHLRQLGDNPHIFVKLSEVPVRVKQMVPKDAAFYKENLDAIWDVFGEDRVLYGSDWPNSDLITSYDDTLRIVQGYVARKGVTACQKFFWKNSIAAYKWHPRQANQHLLQG
jgi:predicted TIM-barrel fold metal-dependent hydrolase